MLNRIILLIGISFSNAFGQGSLPLIPKPQTAELHKGNFSFNANTQFVLEGNVKIEALDLVKEFVKTNFGIEFNSFVSSHKKHSVVCLKLEESTTKSKEAYELTIEKNKIRVMAYGEAGLFYALQTLIELMPLNAKNNIAVPCMKIKDSPQYAWRGMHLDVSRHFFSVDFIKKYLDCLALYKMNTFHWHLTDDQGWRIEIKKYPKLTEIGAVRKKSMVGHYKDHTFDSIPYGGFYTQVEIKEIVAYAKKRFITVIPEIEMPGHAMAALAAYPELACTAGPFEVATEWGVFDDVYCPTESTFTFLENVMDEVLSLFPSEYIHIGGDECPKTRWKTCEKCQHLIKQENLKDEFELQSYFIRRIEKYINAKGRKIIGWDEILEGGLAPNAAVMSWRGTEGGIAAAKQKHFVVMSPGSHCYFDHYQADPKTEPVAIGGYTTLEKVYSYTPTPVELTKEEAAYVLGAQGNVWSEYMTTSDYVEYMAIPRMAALAEVLWGTADPKQFKDFQDRLLVHFALLDKMKVNYCKNITSGVQAK
jgi:hexosaminidase